MSISNRRVLFLGFTVPDDVMNSICDVDPYMPIQTHKFAWSIVNSLNANGVGVDLLSAHPVANYPRNPNLFFKGGRWGREDGSWNVFIPFVNFLGIKHVSRFFSSVMLLLAWVVRTRKFENRLVVVHGIHSPFLYSARIVSWFFGVKSVAVLTDPPNISLPGDGCLIRFFRFIDGLIISFAVGAMDGIIAVTDSLSEKLAPGVPFLVVEGILYGDDVVGEPRDDPDTDFTVLYAGQIKAEYGLELLLETFKVLDDVSVKLVVLGRGDYEGEVIKASSKDDRISFKGFLPQKELNNYINSSTILINPRPSVDDFTRYSFPSKIIEYMLSGKPVISTRLQGIPCEYFDYIFTLEDETPSGLAKLLVDLKNINRNELFEVGDKSRLHILNKKNINYQGKKIVNFIDSLFKD